MRVETGPPRAATSVWLAGYRAARRRFPPRPAQQDWPATKLPQARGQVLAPLATIRREQGAARAGLEGLLVWLQAQEGGSWQQRWLASGADAAGAGWLRLPGQWLSRRGGQARLVP